MVARRGVGSNQYGDKDPSPREDEERASHVRSLNKHSVPVSAERDSEGIRSTRMNVGRLSVLVNQHMDQLGAGDGVQADENLTSAQLRSNIQGIADFEDNIIRQHPNYYGHSVVGSVYWGQAVQRDPRLQRKLQDGDPKVTARNDAYNAILRDATGVERLDVDQLAQAMDTLSETEETESYTDPEKETMDTRAMHRYAALSVVSSRSSDEFSEDDLRAMHEEMERIRGDLNRSMVERRLNLG